MDVLLTPSVPITAPAIPKAALKGAGHSDLTQLSTIMRFAQPANLLGLPAASVPVGVDAKGLPIALQVMGKPWHEATVLRCALLGLRAFTTLLPPALRKQQGGGREHVRKLWVA